MLKTTKIVAVSATFMTSIFTAAHAENCADNKTLVAGSLTIATGNPAYSPWVMNDSPESKEGYEAAIAWEVAKRLGFADDAVSWTRTSFDEAIQPGAKTFDFNIQQFSILPERDAVIDFSDPYYISSKAIVVPKELAATLTEVNADVIRKLQFGAASGQTSAGFIEKYIKPEATLMLYEDMADVTAALQANQVQATVFDLPTAMFMTAVRYPEGMILGQFDEDRGGDADGFGMVFAEGNPLRECVNKVLAEMNSDGTTAAFEAEWLGASAGIPTISLD